MPLWHPPARRHCCGQRAAQFRSLRAAWHVAAGGTPSQLVIEQLSGTFIVAGCTLCGLQEHSVLPFERFNVYCYLPPPFPPATISSSLHCAFDAVHRCCAPCSMLRRHAAGWPHFIPVSHRLNRAPAVPGSVPNLPTAPSRCTTCPCTAAAGLAAHRWRRTDAILCPCAGLFHAVWAAWACSSPCAALILL